MPKLSSVILIQILTLLYNEQFVLGYMVGNNPHHRVETLDSQGKYVLEWRADWVKKRVTFNVTVQTIGYVGFGLSAKGKMTGADIVIGGVTPAGRPYFADRHAEGNMPPKRDTSQDWTLHEARETEQHTFLSFSRTFDTCDPEDYPITGDTIALIWAYGEKDNHSEYHYGHKGMFNVLLLHRDYTPPVIRNPQTGVAVGVDTYQLREVKVWTVSSMMELSTQETTYWCTMHKGPNITKRHQMIGSEARFPYKESRSHYHHLILHKCHVPRGQILSTHSMFGPYVGQPGQPCLNMVYRTGPMPTEFCTETFHGWAVGARIYFHPPHVGQAIDPDDYFILQVHVNNPYQVSGKQVQMHLDFFYTDKLRQFDAGMMLVGRKNPGLPLSSLVPPYSREHTIYGYCSGRCTQTMLPPEGIKIVTITLHSHDTGVRLKFQHFRENKELPWVESDDNYSNQFQKDRLVHKEVHVLPGDQLVTTCVHDNTMTNGTIVGGYSTKQEMCLGIIWYYPRISDYITCRSDLDSETDRRSFLAGVSNVTWRDHLLEYTVDSPHPLEGLTITQVSDNHVDWNLARRDELQKLHKTHRQEVTCPLAPYAREPTWPPPSGTGVPTPDDFVGYPSGARPYYPARTCSFRISQNVTSMSLARYNY